MQDHVCTEKFAELRRSPRTCAATAMLLLALLCSAPAAMAAQPRIVILSPTGGETFVEGQQESVRISTHLRSVTVALSRDGGATFETLGTINSADHDIDKRTSLTWTVTVPASNACVVRVSSGALSATSGMFTINARSGGITTNALADNAVSTPKITDGSVTTSKLADGAVTTAKVSDQAITAAKVSSAGTPTDFVLSADGVGGAVWKPLSSDLAFGNLTDGTNSSATLTLGSGATLTYSGTGTVNANQFKGNSTVAVADGGTGATSLSGFLFGNGTAPVTGIKAQFSGTRAPTSTDDSAAGYAVGSRWLNTVSKTEFVCMDATAGAAVWRQTTLQDGTNVSVPLNPGEKNFTAILYDGTNVWVGTDTAPAMLLKFDPVTNTHVTYTLAAGQNSMYSLSTDGTYLYAGLSTSPAQLIKINKADGSTVAAYSFPGTTNLQAQKFIGPDLWALTHDAPAQLLHINPADGTYTSTTLTGTTAGWGLTYDGTNLWASTSGNPAQFVKIDPGTVTYTVYASPNPGLEGFTFDGANVWALSNDFPAVLIKINTADGTYVTYTMNNGESQSRTMIFDGAYLWAGLIANVILRIDPKNPTAHVDFPTNNPTTALVATGNEIWAGTYNAPGAIYRIGSVNPDATLTTGNLTINSPNSAGFSTVLANMVSNGTSIFNVTNTGVTVGGTGGLVANKANVTGATTLNTLSVSGTSTFTGLATFNGNPIGISVAKGATVGTTLGVTGATTLSSTLGVTGLATLSGGLTVSSGNVTISGAASSLSATGTGGVTIGSGGAPIKNVLSATAALDFPSTAANASSTLTITVTGAADGDPVFLGTPNATVAAGTFYRAWVSASNTVSVRFFNLSGAAVDPPSGTFRVAVFHF